MSRMSTTAWFILIGCLMLARGLGADGIARLPLTSAIAYLGVGLLLGPMFLGLFAFDLVQQAPLLESLTEIAVLPPCFPPASRCPCPSAWRAGCRSSRCWNATEANNWCK